MSAKQQLVKAIEGFPDSITLEDAFERLYRAFQQKRARAGSAGRRPPAELAGTLEIHGDITAPAVEEDDWDLPR
jgi:hypothetical protein